MRIPWFKQHLKSLTLEHAYKSIFSVGSYNSYSSFMQYMGDLGFINDATTGNPIPSSLYDISTVSINEAFSPFIGVTTTLQNDLTFSLRYNRTRVLSLSMASQQLTEASSNDLVIGMGYKINDLKIFRQPAQKRRRSTRHRTAPKPAAGKGASEQGTSGATNNTSSTTSPSTTPTSPGMNNTLNLRLDISLRDQSAINRDILTETSQATSGNKAFKLSFSAEYTLSKLLTLSLYFDRQTTTPLLTSSSYPTTTQDFGLSMKFSLVR